MGYCIFSFGIRTETLKSVFGSKSGALLEKVKATEYYENYGDFSFDGFQTTPGEALQQIIHGEKYDTKSGFAYGYAVICICAALGTALPYSQEIKFGYETDFINKYLSESFSIKDLEIEALLLADDTNPFAIPPINDWPLIGLLTFSELKDIQNRFSSIRITDDEVEKLVDSDEEGGEEKGFAYQHIKGLIDNINSCIENELDLISFCH